MIIEGMELSEEQEAMIAILGEPEVLTRALRWRPADGLEITSSEGGFEVNGVSQSFHGALKCLPKGRVPEHDVARLLTAIAESVASDDWWIHPTVGQAHPDVFPPACRSSVSFEGSRFGVVWDEHFRWASFFGGGPWFEPGSITSKNPIPFGFHDRRFYDAMGRASAHRRQRDLMRECFSASLLAGKEYFQTGRPNNIYSLADRLVWVDGKPAYTWGVGYDDRGDFRGLCWHTDILPLIEASRLRHSLRCASRRFVEGVVADRNARLAALDAEAAPDEKQGPPRSDEDSCDGAQQSDEFDRQIVDFFARYLDRVMPPDVPEARGVKNSLVSALRWSVGALGFFAGAGAVFAHNTIKKVSGNE